MFYLENKFQISCCTTHPLLSLRDIKIVFSTARPSAQLTLENFYKTHTRPPREALE